MARFSKQLKLSAAVALIGAAAVDLYLRRLALGGFRVGSGELRFELFKNPGIALSLPLSLSIVAPLTIGLLVALSYVFLVRRDTKLRLLLAVTFVGAISNLIDRLTHGFTTDYLIIHRLAINIADILIVIGIMGLAWYTQKVPQGNPKKS